MDNRLGEAGGLQTCGNGFQLLPQFGRSLLVGNIWRLPEADQRETWEMLLQTLHNL